MQDSSKEAVVGEGALELLAGVVELVVAQGKKTVRYDLRQERPSDDGLLDILLGRSGKLRAPAIRTGTKLLVGYNSEMLGNEL